MTGAKKDRIVIELDNNLKREFKSQVAMSGKTMKEVVLEYVKYFVSKNRAKNQSK